MPDDDNFVFWYKAPAKDSLTAYQKLMSSWVAAGIVPRQGTPVEIARRTTGAAVQVRQHPPPRTPEDVAKIFTEYPDALIPYLSAQADLYLAGAAVRAQVWFDYIGEDELSPPRVDPRREFMMGTLVLPQYWREKAKGYAEGDPAAAAADIEDALVDKVLRPIAEKTDPLTALSGPEHEGLEWRYREADLRAGIPPRLSNISRYATYLSPAQVASIGTSAFEHLVATYDWLHRQEPRLRPLCRILSNRGVILARWPGTLDREPRFASALSPEAREAFNRVRRVLEGSAL